MYRPMISIITCTKNSQLYLRQTIKSVMQQTYKEYEHIFIDAYSKDKTTDYIYQYKHLFENKVSLFQKEATGISAAMNLGISKAQGDYVLILHSDDWLYDKHVLAKVNSRLLKYKPLVLIGDCLISNNGIISSAFPPNPIERWFHHHFPLAYLFLHNNIPHPSVYVKRSLHNRFGDYDENLKTVMDYDMWFRLAPYVKFHFLDSPLSFYRAHKDTTSNNNFRLVDEEIKVVLARYAKRYPLRHRWGDFVIAVMKKVRKI